MITEHLQRPGTGDIRFTADFPASAALQIAKWLPDSPWNGPGCHLVITPTRIDPTAIGDTAALAQAIYTGRIDTRPSRRSIGVNGLGVWLDSYLDAPVSRTAGTPTQWLGDLLINGFTVGAVAGGSSVTRAFPTGIGTRRQCIDAIAATGGWKYRINPNFTVDAGTNLFVATPRVIVTRDTEGPDGTLRGINGGLLDQNVDVGSIATKALNLAGTEGAGIVLGTATKATSLKTPTGGSPTIVAATSAPGDAATNATTIATNFLNLQATRRAIDISSTTPQVRNFVAPGDAVYLWDPDTGLFDTTAQVIYRGEVLNPMAATVLSITWPSTGMGHYIRSNTGSWLDVSDWVEDEGNEAWWTIGDWAPESFGRVNRTSPSIEDRVTSDQRGVKFLPANVDNSTTAFADVTGLGISVDPTKRYRFRWVIYYDVPVTTTGSAWAVNGPAGGLLRMTSRWSLTATTDTVNNAVVGYDLPGTANATSAAKLGNVCVMEGTYQSAIAGTLIARFKSEVAASTVSARASGFSFVEWTEALI